MSWFSLITGLFQPAKELIEVFKPNAGQTAERDHVERMALTQQDLASLQQFAAEFHDRTGRTWWDSLIDGLNRLPRPLITLGILAFFVLAPLQPVRFLEIAQAYQMMPDGFWALLGVIIAFYFGGRMQLKGQDMAVKGGALAVAREILAIRRAEQQLNDPAPEPAHASEAAPAPSLPPATNRVVEEWRLRHTNGEP
jgi:holin (3TMs family)